MSLVNNESREFVEEFLKADPPHNFQEYGELIKKFHELSKKIPVQFERTVFIGLFEVRRKEFLDLIASNARNLRDELVDRLVFDYRHKSRA